jgi:hypothetical protein
MRLIHIDIKYSGQAGTSLGHAMRGGLAALIPCRLACRAGSNLLGYLLGASMRFGSPFRVPRPQHNSLSSTAISQVPENTTTVRWRQLLDRFVGQRQPQASIHYVFAFIVLFELAPYPQPLGFSHIVYSAHSGLSPHRLLSGFGVHMARLYLPLSHVHAQYASRKSLSVEDGQPVSKYCPKIFPIITLLDLRLGR